MCMAPPPSLIPLLSCAQTPQPTSQPQDPAAPVRDDTTLAPPAVAAADDNDAATAATPQEQQLLLQLQQAQQQQPHSQLQTQQQLLQQQLHPVSQATTAAAAAGRPQQQQPHATQTDGHISPPIPTAATRLASALEAGYAYARQCVRAGHGIRLLKQLLQPRPAAPSHFISECSHACACNDYNGYDV